MYQAGKTTGNSSITDWNQIATLEEGPDSLVARFHKSLNRGYPKNYKPELVLMGLFFQSLPQWMT